MRQLICLSLAVTLMRVIIGDMDVDRTSVDVEKSLPGQSYVIFNRLHSSPPEGVATGNQRVPDVDAARFPDEIEDQLVWKDPLYNTHTSNRRAAFSPWGGKRYFNPWGGKRFRGITMERMADGLPDKRPGFQPWGGKRSPVTMEEREEEKRAFSPWGGKRSGLSSYDSSDYLSNTDHRIQDDNDFRPKP